MTGVQTCALPISDLSIIALRNAIAVQKYKEIQLANDVDFASQIEAHFGVKPKHADDISYFIGGSSSMIDINPIVNQNLSGDGQADYKASPIGGIVTGKKEEKLGIRGSDTHSLMFTDVKVPKENRIGEDGFGFNFAMAVLNGGRIGIASQAAVS